MKYEDGVLTLDNKREKFLMSEILKQFADRADIIPDEENLVPFLPNRIKGSEYTTLYDIANDMWVDSNLGWQAVLDSHKKAKEMAANGENGPIILDASKYKNRT